MTSYPDVESARNYLSNLSDDDFGYDTIDFNYFPNYDKYQQQNWLMSLVDNNMINYNLLLEEDVLFIFRFYVSKIMQSYFQIVNSKTNKDVPDNAGYA